MKRLLRWTYKTALVLAGLVILAVAYSQTPWFHQNLRSFLLTNAAKVIDGDVRIGEISGNLFTGVVIHDVAVRRDSVDVLTAKRVEVRYEPLGLLSGRISIVRGRLIDGHLELIRSPAGGWNIAKLIKPAPADSTPSKTVIDLRQVQLLNYSISVTDSVVLEERRLGTSTAPESTDLDPAFLRLKDVELTVGALIAGKEYDCTIRRCTFRSDHPFFELANLTAHVVITPRDTRVEGLHIETHQTYIRLDAELHDQDLAAIHSWEELGHKRMALRLYAPSIDMRELKQFLPRGVNFLDGRGSLAIAAQGTPSRLVVDSLRLQMGPSLLRLSGTLFNLDRTSELEMDIKGTDCTIDPNVAFTHLPGLNLPDLRTFGPMLCDLKYKGRPSRFDAGIDARFGAGDVKVDGTLDFTGEEMEYAGEIRTRHFDLGTFLDKEDLLSSFNSRITVSGTGTDPRSMLALVRAEVDSSSFRDFDLRKSLVVIDVADGSARVRTDVTAGQTNVAMAATFVRKPDDDYSFSAEGTVNSLNLTQLLDDPRYESDLSFRFTAVSDRSDFLSGKADISVDFLRSVYGSHEYSNSSLKLSYDLRDSLRGSLKLASEPIDAQVHGRFSIDGLIASLPQGPIEVVTEVIGRIKRLNPLRSAISPIRPPRGGKQSPVDTARLDYAYDITMRDLHPLGVFLGVDMAGDCTAHGTVRGSRDSAAHKGELTIPVLDLIVDSTIITADSARFAYEVTPFKVRPSLEDMNSTTRLTARVLTVDGSTFSRASFYVEQASTLLMFSVSALYDSSASIASRGSLLFRAGTAALTLNTLTASFATYTLHNPADILMVLGSDALSIRRFELVDRSESISLSGFFNPFNVSDLTVRVANFSLQKLQHLAGRKGGAEFRDFFGTGHVDGWFRGSLDHPNLYASILVDSLRAAGQEFGRLSGTLAYFEGRLTVADTVRPYNPGRGQASFASMNGSIPYFLAFKGNRNVRPSGVNDMAIVLKDFRLEILDPFVKELTNLKGSADLDMHIGGTYDAPEYQGSIVLNRTSFFFEPILMAFTADGRLTARGNRIYVDEFNLRNTADDFDQGLMHVGGSFALNGLSIGAFDFSLAGQLLAMKESAPLPGQPYYGNLVLGIGKAGVRWQGTLEQSFLRGDVLVHKADITIPPMRQTTAVASREIAMVVMDDTSRVVARPQGNDARGKTNGNGNGAKAPVARLQLPGPVMRDRTIIDNMNMDLNLTLDGPAQFRFVFNKRFNEELLVDMKGKLTMTKEGDVMKLFGEPELTDASYYEQLRKRFSASGTVVFVGDIANPQLNISARYEGTMQKETTILRVAVVIELSGTIKEPKTKFALEENSERVKDRPDIESDALSFILTGKYLSALTQQELSTVNQTAVIGLTSSMLAGSFLGYIRRQFGFSVDVLYYGGNFQEEADVRLTGAVGTAVVRLGGRVFNDINNTNLSVQLPMNSVINADFLSGLILEIESRMEGTSIIDQRRANAVRVLYRIAF